MLTQTDNRLEIPLNGVGPIGKIKSPQILENIISKMPEGYVACDFLNRTVGGVTCSLLPEMKARERYAQDHSSWDASDEKLMRIYTKEDLLLQKSYLSAKK